MDSKRLDQKTGSSKNKIEDDRTRQQIGPLWSRLTTNTDTGGIDPGRGSSVKSEYKP